jgi:hypothetical protein
MFVAVGDGGKCAYSADGVTWTGFTVKVDSPVANNMQAVTWANGKFVAVNDDMWCMYSFDGKGWTGIDIKVGSSDNLYGIAYGNGRFVAVSQGGNGFYSSLANITARLVFKADGTVGWLRV